MKIILTDHAFERMIERSIQRSMVRDALHKPDKTSIEDDGDTRYERTIKQRNLHVVAKPLPEEGRDVWLVKTMWVRGEDDPNVIVKLVRRGIAQLLLRRGGRREL